MAYLGVGLLELAVAYLVSPTPAVAAVVVVEVVVCLSVKLELILAAGLVDTPT